MPADPENADDLEMEIDKLYRSYARALLHHLLLVTRQPEDASDLLQETFIRFTLRRRSGKEIEHPYGYLLRISTRLAIKSHKIHDRRSGLSHKMSFTAAQPLPDAQVALVELLESIWKRLDPRERIIAKALIVDMLNDSEIARYTGIARTTVQRKVKKIRRLIGNRWERSRE